jgi:hypothetical protein
MLTIPRTTTRRSSIKGSYIKLIDWVAWTILRVDVASCIEASIAKSVAILNGELTTTTATYVCEVYAHLASFV